MHMSRMDKNGMALIKHICNESLADNKNYVQFRFSMVPILENRTTSSAAYVQYLWILLLNSVNADDSSQVYSKLAQLILLVLWIISYNQPPDNMSMNFRF